MIPHILHRYNKYLYYTKHVDYKWYRTFNKHITPWDLCTCTALAHSNHAIVPVPVKSDLERYRKINQMGPLRMVNITATKPDKIKPSVYYIGPVYLTCEAREFPTVLCLGLDAWSLVDATNSKAMSRWKLLMITSRHSIIAPLDITRFIELSWPNYCVIP